MTIARPGSFLSCRDGLLLVRGLGASRPFIVTAWVSAFGAIASLPQHLRGPLYLASTGNGFSGLPSQFLPSFLPVQLGLIGSAQVVSIGAFHVKQRQRSGKRFAKCGSATSNPAVRNSGVRALELLVIPRPPDRRRFLASGSRV